MPGCIHNEGCLTTIHIKNEPFTVGDVEEALDEFKNMNHAFKVNTQSPKEIVKGTLTFEVGNVQVIMFKKDDSHIIQPCLQSGLKKKSNPSALKNDVKEAFDQLKAKKILPSAQQKKPNVQSSFEESKAKADVIPSSQNVKKKPVTP